MMTSSVHPSRRVLVECVHSATAAPSLHNSQPWRFRIRRNTIDVYADRSRHLAVLDPEGRELLLSVGAAILTLRVALRQAGYLSDLHLFPSSAAAPFLPVAPVSPAGPVSPAAPFLPAAPSSRAASSFLAAPASPAGPVSPAASFSASPPVSSAASVAGIAGVSPLLALVARVTVTHPEPVPDRIAALAAAIPHRHTNRLPFAHLPVPPPVLDELRAAARAEGAVLAVASPPAAETILSLTRTAEDCLHARPGYRQELARWTGDPRHDGVPSWAAGPLDTLDSIPIRDFTELSPAPRPAEPFETHPTLLVLATHGDTPADWIRAGQALQRVLLTATWHDLAASPIGQPTEVPAVRRRLLDPATGLAVQMVLRIGYGRTAGRTPRRPLSEVVSGSA